MKKFLTLVFFLTLIILSQSTIFSHCEVPCGIYNDEMRFTMIAEHIQTIEKAMQQVTQLSEDLPQNMNQIVRWITNKEKHAEEIQNIISQYFLTQRIKGAVAEDKKTAENYVKKLTLCHQVLVFAMKCKQTTDLDNVKKLTSLVGEFKKIYFTGKK